MANFKKRAFPLFMALVMIFTMLPMDAMAFGGPWRPGNPNPNPNPNPPAPTEPVAPTEPEAPVYVVGGMYEFDSAPAVELLPQCTAWQYVGLSDKLITEHGEHTHDESCNAVCEAEGCVGGKLDCPDCDGGKKTVDCDKCVDGKVTVTVDCKGNNGPSAENSFDHCDNGWVKIGRNTECHEVGCENCGGDGKVDKTGKGTMTDGVFTACPHECDCFPWELFWCDCYDDCYCDYHDYTVTCSWCAGTGKCHTGADGSTACWKKCKFCDGAGNQTVIVDCTAEGCVNGFITVDCSCGDGVTDIYCTACGGTGKVIACGEEEHTHTDECYKLKYTIVVSHTNVVTDEAVASTCEGTGLTEGSHCDACGTVIVAQTETAKLGHAWNDGVVTTAPTCEIPGVKTFTCQNDASHTYTEEVAATGHTEKAPVVENIVDPDCENAGSYDTVVYCDVCGEELSRVTTTVAKLGHSYDNGVVTTAPTCEDVGVKTFTCGTCGDTYTEAVDATGHTEEIVDAVAPTCEGTGLTEGVRCSVCDAWIVEQETVDALGHDWSEEATYNWDGYTACTATIVCQNDESHTKELTCAVTGVITTEATCAVDGIKTYTATTEFDGKTYTSTKEENLGKNMENHDKENCECFRTVTFVVENGKTGKTDVYGPFEVKYGEAAEAPQISVPAGYSLGEWSADFSSVTENMEVTASITRNFGDYDVALYVGYGKNGSTTGWTRAGTGKIYNAYDPLSYSKGYMDLPEGARFEGTPSDVAITKDGVTYTVDGNDFYTLNGGNLVVGESDGYHMDYQATFWHTVVFKDYNGDELSIQELQHGAAVTVPTPTRAADETYTYEFIGWDKEVSTTCNASEVYTAVYESTYIDYTVKFIVEGETFEATYHYGDTVVVPEATKAEDNTYTYVFEKWTPEVSTSVTGNAEYTASFTPVYKNYTITFLTHDGQKIEATDYHYGDKIDIPAAPEREGYTFTGWGAEIDDVTGTATFTAQYTINQYTITFVLGNGSADVVSTQDYGTAIETPAAPQRAFYIFAGWDAEIPATMPAGDVTITAVWVLSPFENQVPGGEQNGEVIIEDEEVPLADGSLLNTDEYIAYIAGFEDATVRPEKLITRAEFATIMFRLLNDDFRLENWGTESRFTDVEEDDWYFVEVTTCDNIGLLDHYEGEEFLPNEPITREEVAYIIAMFIEDAYEGEEALFTDIDDSFAFDAINDCKTVGIIGGDGDGKFRPQDTIKRAEVAKMVNLLLGRDAEELVGDLRNWIDNAEGKWYYDFIRVASNSFDAETLEVIEVDADYWKNKKEEWAAAFAALIPEDESEDDEEIEG